MILDLDGYRRQSETDRWEDLRRMTIAESIAVGEALLTSEVMRLARFAKEAPCRSLAVSLGIAGRARRRPQRAGR